MLHNLYVGTWGFVLQSMWGETLCDSGYNSETINVELQSIIDGLTEIPEGDYVTVYSENRYTVKGINDWHDEWYDNGWEGVAYPELWQQIDELLQILEVEAVWVEPGLMSGVCVPIR